MRPHHGTYTGRLTKDAELRYTPNGHPVANLDIALNERVKNDNGDWKDGRTTYVSVRVWGRLSEAVAELGKGQLIAATTSKLPEVRPYLTNAKEAAAQLTITADSISRVLTPPKNNGNDEGDQS